jgi:hypothetical protein
VKAATCVAQRAEHPVYVVKEVRKSVVVDTVVVSTAGNVVVVCTVTVDSDMDVVDVLVEDTWMIGVGAVETRKTVFDLILKQPQAELRRPVGRADVVIQAGGGTAVTARLPRGSGASDVTVVVKIEVEMSVISAGVEVTVLVVSKSVVVVVLIVLVVVVDLVVLTVRVYDVTVPIPK